MPHGNAAYITEQLFGPADAAKLEAEPLEGLSDPIASNFLIAKRLACAAIASNA